MTVVMIIEAVLIVVVGIVAFVLGKRKGFKEGITNNLTDEEKKYIVGLASVLNYNGELNKEDND